MRLLLQIEAPEESIMAWHRSLLSADLEAYVRSVGARETPAQRRLREATAALPQAAMQIGPDQATFLALLVRLLGAGRALEIGTFTGYSALAVAQALPEDGTLVCCDVSREWTAVGQPFWREAGVASRIDLRIAPAQDTLRELTRSPGPASFDFAFIDADKSGYDAYYEACLALLRQGGLVVIDNTLWSGTVADASNQEPDTRALRALNAKIHADARVDACLLSIGDGVTLARKR
jgi:predicted O-methyltransferase YrrM